MWSIGSWGGAGLGSLFGGLMAQTLGWRWIFFVSVAVALLGLWLVRGTPESKAAGGGAYRFDFAGILVFAVAMLALQVVVTQGSTLGWGSPLVLGLIAVTVIAGIAFFRIESGSDHASSISACRQPHLHRRHHLQLPDQRHGGHALVSRQLVQMVAA